MNEGPTPLGSLLLLLILIAFIWGIGQLAARIRGGIRERRADEELDRRFNGESRVRYTVEPSSLRYETVYDGAEARGYKLVDKDGRRGSVILTFDRAGTPGRD